MLGRKAVAAVFCGALVFAACGDAADEDTTRDESGEIQESGEVGILKLQQGDCIAEIPEGGDLSSVEAVSCDESHAGELFALEPVDSDDYPGDEATDTLLAEFCGAEFETFVGVSYDESRLELLNLRPTSGSWDEGDKSLKCFVFDPGVPTVGSLEGIAE